MKTKQSYLRLYTTSALCLTILVGETSACTIFSCSVADQVLAANNEDWSNSKTRIWFLPADEGKYG